MGSIVNNNGGIERENTEVEKFFTGMSEDEKRDNKSLRCKLAKEIFKREAMSKKVSLLEFEKQEQNKQTENATETIKTL